MFRKLRKKIKRRFASTPPKSNREQIAEKALRFACYNDIDGDYLEFGVYLGRTFAYASKFAQNFSPKWKHRDLKTMRFFGFDSFEGIPETSGIDKSGTFVKGQFDTTLNEVKAKLVAKGVDFNKAQLVPGFFDKVLNQETKERLGIKKAAVVFFDCDLYESTVSALNFVKGSVVDGTIFIFGDWNYFKGNPARGVRRAFKEWLVANPEIKISEFHKFGWEGNSFVIHKN